VSFPEVPDICSSYLKLIGKLIYLSVNSRPDIAYIVNSLAQFNARPAPHNLAAAKRVLQYLAGTLNHRLSYGGDTALPELHGYADASWANESGCRLVSGYAWFYAGGLLSHMSKKQATVALSSTEAEYMAVIHVIQEGLWLKSLFTELSVPFQTPIKIFLDNTGAIALSTATKFHQRTKHIDIRYHFIWEHVDNGTFHLIWVPSHENIADIFTKPRPRPDYMRLSKVLGLAAS
jgi:hypothetical protein